MPLSFMPRTKEGLRTLNCFVQNWCISRQVVRFLQSIAMCSEQRNKAAAAVMTNLRISSGLAATSSDIAGYNQQMAVGKEHW
jgi:hypothetical protein